MIDYEPFILVLLVVVLLYIGAPLHIRFSQKHHAHPNLESLDFDRIDPSIREFFMSRTAELFDLGFDEPTLVHIPRPTTDIKSYLIMLVNRRSGDKAMVTAVVAPGRQVLYTEFSTRFENGQVFNTHNVPELLYRSNLQTVRTQVPQVQDANKLYKLHIYIIDKHAAQGRKVLYEPDKALEYLAGHAFIETFENYVTRGLMFYDHRTDCYRPTTKGAFLMTWGLMQPMKAIRYVALRRRAREIMEEFEQENAMRAGGE
jgi:hypothetical protein